MSVGDAFINGGAAQSVIDEMGGGDATEAGGTGSVVAPGGGGDEGGIGVEAAAVVVITLLAVLGNAMVVATLVRRSMLQHPSNRLVLSLTGSNLILTVVVLPGMVTSLLMTPSSPVDQRSNVLTHTYNQSDRPSSEKCNNSLGNSCDIGVSLALSQQPQNDTSLMSHTSNGTSVELKNDMFLDNMPLEGFSSSIPLTNQATDAFISSHSESSPRLLSSVPSYITTQSPNFGDVADTINSFPFSLRENDGSSTFSHQWEGFDSNQHDVENLQIHQPTVASTNHNSVKQLDTEELILKGGLSVETHRQDALQKSNHRGHVKAKASLAIPDDIGDNQEEGIGVKKEIISRSIHAHNNMFPENKISVEKDEELCACNDEVNQNNRNQNDGNHQDSSNSQKNHEEHQGNNKILNNEEKVQQETLVQHGEIRPFDSGKGNKHTARMRKPGTRHHHHLENRRRRSRDNSGYSHNIETRQDSNKEQTKNHGEGSIRDVGAIKQLIRQDQRALHREDSIQEDSDAQVLEESSLLTKSIDLKEERAQEHIEQEVHLQIKQQQQSGKHVILVRGVQEIEEQQENKVLLLLVDHEQPLVKEESLQLRLNENDSNFQSIDEKYPSLAEIPPVSDQDDHNNQNLSQDDQGYPEDLPLVQEQVMNSVELQIEEELQEENKAGDSEEQQMEQMEQIYGGVEWESDGWEGGKILCQGAAFFTNLISAASALTVAVIAIDRYLAIVRPLVYGAMVTSGRCLLMLAWCWGQALLTALPPLLGWARYERREPYGRCGVAWGKSPSYTAVWTISVFLIPFGIMVVCYYHILQVARNKCRRIRVGKVSESSPPVTPITTSTCLEGFPFPLSVEHLTSPPMGSKIASPLATGPIVGKISPIVNLSSPQGKGPDPPLVRNISINGGLESYLDKPVPCRSHSISGILRVTDSTNTNESSIKPKRKLADFGRSRSLCQVPQQPPRPCLRRVQSTFSVRHTLKKLSLGTRRPSWNYEGSPSKGFWTVFVVMGAHILTWGPYTVMAVAEAILGREHLLLLPHWVMVTCTLLLFTASVFYPIVYGLYNRNIRKELLTCLCPTWSRRRGSHLRRPSTVPSYSGSVLDFTSLRQRCVSDKTEQCYNSSNGITETIASISSRVSSLTYPSPLMILGGRDEALPTRGYNLNHRKPSQDSGTVMVGGEDQDSDTEAFAPTPRQYTTRRVSAPSVLSTVREDPHSTAVTIEDVHHISRHHSMNSRNVSYPLRKLPIVPLSVQLNATSPEVHTSLRRSFSLDKIHSSDKDISLDIKVTYRSLRKKRSNPLIRETQFNTPPASERTQRRRGSVAVVKVMSIPEDSGMPDYPEVTDSGRGSVDSGNISKTRVMSSRGSVDSTDFTKTYSLRCQGSVDSTDLGRIPILSRRGSVDSTELAMARAMSKRQSVDSVDLSKISAARQVSIDEGIGGDCLPEETASWE